MSSPANVSQYGPYVDLQNYTGSAAPATSGSLWLSGSNASEVLYANVGLNVAGTLTGDTSLTLDSTTLTTAELAVLDSVTAGTAAASKAVVLDASKNIATIGTIGCGAITSTGASTMGSLNIGGTLACDTSFTIDTTTLNATELGYVDGVTAGTAAVSKALVLDASGDIGTINALTATYAKIGTLDVNTINSVTQTATSLEIEDKLIVAALSASSANSADGGLRIGGGGQSVGHASVLWDHANTALDFNITVGGSEVTQVRLTDGALLPQTDSDVDLGSSTLQFKDVHADAGYIDAITVTGTSTLTTVDINGGAIDGVTIGATSAGAGTFAALVGTSLSVSDGNITNVGVIEADTIQSDADTAGLNVNFDGNTGTNKISLKDNLAEALTIEEGGNDYLKFVTTNGGEYMSAHKELAFGAGASIAQDQHLAFGNNSASPDGEVMFEGTQLVLSGGAGGVAFSGSVVPSADNSWSLGTSAKQFKDLYVNGAAYIDTLGEALDANSQNISNVGNLEVDGTATFNGAVTLGDAATDVINVTGRLTASAGILLHDDQEIWFGDDQDAYIYFDDTNHILAMSGTVSGTVHAGAFCPSTDDLFDLGNLVKQWRNLYIDGTAYLDAVDIDGGNIDSTAIGAGTPAAGTFTTLDCTNGAFAVDNLDIDGATDIGANLATADLIMVDDGATGTNRKSTLARVVTLMESEIDELGSVTFGGTVTVGSNGSGYDVKFFGTAANEYVLYDASEHTMQWVDSGGSAHVTIGGDSNSEYAVDVASGSNNKNKIRAASFVTYSDERLKSDVSPMRNALETVNSLNAVNFTWKKDGSKDFGFMAQELRKSIPQAVHGTEEGLFGVDYGRLTAVLVSAIQEQSAQIKDLQAKLNKK